jgi:hypothetical protein
MYIARRTKEGEVQIMQGCTYVTRIYKPPQNSVRQRAEIKQVPY